MEATRSTVEICFPPPQRPVARNTRVVALGPWPDDLAGPQDYKLDCSKLIERLRCNQVESVRVAVHPDVQFTSALPESWQKLDFDTTGA